MKNAKGLSARTRILLLVLLLVVSPAASGADPTPDPTWIEIIQQWFETLLNGDTTTDEDGGVVHIPGG